MALAAAPEVPGFRALSPLGYGPTSTVFSAQSISLGRWVALTVYSTTLTDDRAQRRFQRAFEMARRLGSHPHAVTLLDHGLTLERQPYVASEIYERGTLESRIGGRQPLSVDEALRTVISLAGVLETAQRAGVIHGGVHPARVLVGTDGEPALADLNLVQLVESAGMAALVGPKYHASPEVLEAEELTPATDVYSLASTLYTLLAGRPPYQGPDPDADTVVSLLLRILQYEVPRVGRRDVPPSLETRLAQALAPQAASRPATPLAFATLLQSIQQELSLPVTDPVVLDVPPAVTLSVAGSEPPVRSAPPPVPAALPAAASTGASGAASTTPRAFVPYLPPVERAEPAKPVEVVEPPRAGSVSVFGSDAQPVYEDGWQPDQADPEPNDPEPEAVPAPAGTSARALPVMVLMSLVAVLVVGVSWMIVTGEDPNQGEDSSTQSSAALQETGEVAPGSVTAVENANGVQIDWDGSAEGQVVLVLSQTEAPRTLPAETGSALLIGPDQLRPDTGYCFAVVPATDPPTPAAELAAEVLGDVTTRACIRGATPDTVVTS